MNRIDVETKALVGRDVPEPLDLLKIERNCAATNVPQFSWTRLAGADHHLCVEMSSTDETACSGKDLVETYWASAQSAMNFRLPLPGEGLLFGGEASSGALVQIAKYIQPLGYKFFVANHEIKNILDNGVEGMSVEIIEFH